MTSMTLVIRRIAVALGVALLAVPAVSLAATPAPAPTWAQLDADKRQVLAPLEQEWDRMSAERRKKWFGIAQRYPKMKPAEQERVQRRMIDWVRLSPQQRREARENYRKLGKLNAEKKADLAQRWAEYQALPEAERNSLVAPPQNPEPKRRSRSVAPPKP